MQLNTIDFHECDIWHFQGKRYVIFDDYKHSTNLESMSGYAFWNYVVKNRIHPVSSLDTRFYDLNEPIPVVPSGAMPYGIYFAEYQPYDLSNFTPDMLEFIRKVRVADPEAEERLDMQIYKRSDMTDFISFMNTETGKDYLGYHDFGTRFAPFDEAMLVHAFVQLAQEAQEVFDAALMRREQAKVPQPKTGAISEGNVGNRDFSGYEKTGKSVSADDIDDLIDRITTDLHDAGAQSE